MPGDVEKPNAVRRESVGEVLSSCTWKVTLAGPNAVTSQCSATLTGSAPGFTTPENDTVKASPTASIVTGDALAMRAPDSHTKVTIRARRTNRRGYMQGTFETIGTP